jgi:macrolide-specific efflux system membrane fusion protein
MHKNKLKLFFIILFILVIAVFAVTRLKQKKSSDEIAKDITPVVGTIRTFISCTGTVLPKNRLEVKPPVNGRIEKILVKEGDRVKPGQILAWMSSTERAALLDAARGQGEKSVEYWEKAYNPIPLPASINAEVIVAKTQPGQTVTTADAVIVLSDHLIVRAQVDETDIGKITPAMKAIITLDAYPDTKIQASVEHIYYESKTVNNVTMYEVDLMPQKVPKFFRSGMNATVDFTIEDKEGILLIPAAAVRKEGNENYVLLKEAGSKDLVKRVVKLGITDDKSYEVISGVTANDTIIITTKKYVVPATSSTTGSNPFMPKMPTRKKS